MIASEQDQDLDLLIDAAFSSAQIECGCPISLVVARAPRLAPLSAMTVAPVRRTRNPNWTAEEDNFLRRNMGYKTFATIGEELGRSEAAVELRHERIGVPRPLVDPRFISANKIANILGIDEHKVCFWIDRGLLPGEYVVSRTNWRRYRRVNKTIFLRWITNPANWIWFDPEAVLDPLLHHLLARKKELWGDEWWNTGQVAEYHGVDRYDVKRYIKIGWIKAIQAPNRGGRGNMGWSNWFVLRSEATRPDLRFIHRSDIYQGRSHHSRWSERGDAFLVLARAIGVSVNTIAVLFKTDSKSIDHHLRIIIREGKAPEIIERFGLDVDYQDGKLWADWRLHRRRFPGLDRAMRRFDEFIHGHDYPDHYYRRHRSIPLELYYVRGVLASFAVWFASNDAERRLARKFGHGSQITPKALRRNYEILKSWGLDPL